ncbi:MAG: hypothetical protein RMI79_05455 [Nitrososphaerota archaeon]|nr:hypothetical protein [Nitrososphaerota archaeon]
MLNLMVLMTQIIVEIIIVAPVLWIAGRLLVGKEKAKFTDAILIVVFGVILGVVIGALLHGLIGALVIFIVWLALIKHFFDCGWLKAFVIVVLAAILFIIIAVIIGTLLGVTLLTFL